MAEWPGFFTCHYGNTEMEQTPKYETAQTLGPGEEISPFIPAWTRTQNLSVTSPAPYHRASHIKGAAIIKGAVY